MCLWILNSLQTAGSRQPTVWNKNGNLQITHYWGTYPTRPPASRQSSFHFDGSYSVELAFLQNPTHFISAYFWNTPPKTHSAQKAFAKLLWKIYCANYTCLGPGLSWLVGFGFGFFFTFCKEVVLFFNNFFALITFYFTSVLVLCHLKQKTPHYFGLLTIIWYHTIYQTCNYEQ